MKLSLTTLGLSLLISLTATQSFAGGGQVGSAETLVGTYRIGGPTNDPGDENTITFTAAGNVYLAQRSAWGNLSCEGQFQVQKGILEASGSCSNNSGFEMSIDMTEVSDLGYFRAQVLNTVIYPKMTQMEFLRTK